MSLTNFKLLDHDKFILSNPHTSVEGFVYKISFTYLGHDIQTHFYMFDQQHYSLHSEYDPSGGYELADEVIITADQFKYLEKQLNAIIRGYHDGK